jgi:predicted RNA polymerase sigma factor
VTTTGLVEHFFRHEYGRLVSGLTRRVGVQHLELVEDAVQSALLTAPPRGWPSWTGSCPRRGWRARTCGPLADLHARNGAVERAERYRALALDGAPTPAVARLLHRRLDRQAP